MVLVACHKVVVLLDHQMVHLEACHMVEGHQVVVPYCYQEVAIDLVLGPEKKNKIYRKFRSIKLVNLSCSQIPKTRIVYQKFYF